MSYFILELDTTSPEVEIYAPDYTTRETENIVTIKANEALSSQYEARVIDSDSNIHELNFLMQDESTLFGRFTLPNASLGEATLYVIVSDEVGNVTESVFVFEIKESVTILKQELTILSRTQELEIQTMKIDLMQSTMPIESTQKVRDLYLEIESREGL